MKTIKIIKQSDHFAGTNYVYQYPRGILNGVCKIEVEGMGNKIITLKTFKKHERIGIDIDFDYGSYKISLCNSIKQSWQNT